MLRGLQRDDLFTVVLEQFQNDTADYADILLPATTFLEHTDLYLAYGHYYLATGASGADGARAKRSRMSRFSARWRVRMGFDDACFGDSEDDMIRTLLDSRASVSSRDHARRTGARAFRPPARSGRRRSVPALCARAVSVRRPASANFVPETLAYTPPVESRFGDESCGRAFRWK